MDPNLYQAASQLSPDEGRAARLYALAVSPGEASGLESHVRKGLWVVAALLLGCGLIFWVAANWQEQSRMFRLGLIQGALLVSVLAACLWPRVRLAALFCATLVLGGLLAFVGQAYQTGADAWQLFAVWAALAMIWVSLSRSDWLWLLWVLIAATGLAMWTGRFDLWDGRFDGPDSQTQALLNMALWLLLAVVPALVSQISVLRVQGGMGWWSHRVALACAHAGWTALGVMQVLAGYDGHISVPVLMVAALLIGGTLWLSLKGRFQDFVCICLATLAVNALVLALVGRWVAQDIGVESFLIFGLIAMGCLGLSVRWLMGVHRQLRAQEVAQ